MRSVTLCLLLALALGACSARATESPPDTEATVQAAIAATNMAATAIAATVEAAVAAGQAEITPTDSAAGEQPATAPAPAASPIPAITLAPTATPVDATSLSEEELAALIDQAVNEAVAAAESAANVTTTAAADDSLTQDETQTVQVYVTYSGDAVAEAQALIDEYYALYGELATETLAVVQAMEQDLDEIAASTAAIDAELQAIEDTLDQGLELAEDSVAQLEAAAEEARAAADELQTQAQSWLATVQAELETRAANALNVQPNQVAGDRRGAIESAHQYADAVRDSLADERVTQTELANIAQLGANAGASLQARGGPDLQRDRDSINNLTAQLARGELPAARTSLDDLRGSLPARP